MLGILASAITIYTPGQALFGGYYVGDYLLDGIRYMLIISPKSYESSLLWKTTNSSSSSANSLVNGALNSEGINNSSHPGAQYCRSLNINGYTDWYLPSVNELEILTYNLKPDTGGNQIGSGINLNAIPPRSTGYTIGNPNRVIDSRFRTGGSEALSEDWHWTSTDYSSLYTHTAMVGQGAHGLQSNGTGYPKASYAFKVRAIRRVVYNQNF